MNYKDVHFTKVNKLIKWPSIKSKMEGQAVIKTIYEYMCIKSKIKK